MPDLSGLFDQFLKSIGEDTTREGLQLTPERASSAWQYWTKGYRIDPASVLKTFTDGAEHYDALVFQGKIPIYSHCEHHLAPFFGVAHIGYLPKDKIVGLSKLSRICTLYAQRLQVQERLTRNIADLLFEHLRPRALGVVLRCRHLCMESRGIQKAGTITYTSALLGSFRDHGPAREEFMHFVGLADAQTQI